MKTLSNSYGRLFTLLLVLLITFESCTRPVAPNIVERYLPSSIYGAIGSAHYAGEFDAGAQNNENGADAWTSNTGAKAYFFDTNGTAMLLSSGVSIGSTSLGHNTFYIQSPISGWDSLQIWHITDGGEIGTFTDTIVSPRLFAISYPYQLMHHDSVSISSGFTISYSSTRADSVSIIITTDQQLAHAIDSNISVDTSIHTYLSSLLPSTGSFTVSPSYLSSFPAHGILQVDVIAQNKKITNHYGRQFRLASACDASVSTFIKP